MNNSNGISLAETIYKSGITCITGVPDSAFQELIASLEDHNLDTTYIQATREDNAIALAVGAYLAGEQPIVFMESSGVGNIIDALTSLAIIYEIPLVLFVAWAGYKGRDVPHHNAIGKPLVPLFELLDVPTKEVQLFAPVEEIGSVIKDAIEQAKKQHVPVAVLGIPEDLADDKR